MKNVDKMSERELRIELRAVRGLLASGRCSDPACLLGRVTGKQTGPSRWEHHDCEWCAERSELIGNVPV